MKSILLLALISCCAVLTPNQSLAQERRISKPAAVAAETSDRELDGLFGPVRRVRVEIAKITVKDGNFSEGPRVLRETSTYDPKGKKIDTVAHPVEGTSLPGKEEYKYDDSGNIVEMILRGEDGSILSKETYTYELDEIGNWKKMTSSVAIYENGKLVYEPVEVTYRTISYYFGQAVDKLVASNRKQDAPPVKKDTIPVKVNETKISQAANTSPEQINVPTGSAVSGPTNSMTQTTLKSIESPTDKVVPTADNTAARDSSSQPTKAAHAPADTRAPNTEARTAANIASPPIEPPTAQPTAEKTESKKVDAPTDTTLTNPEVKAPVTTEVKTPVTTEVKEVTTEVKETVSNTKPVESGKTAEAPAAGTASSTPANPAAAAYEQGITHLAAHRFAEAVKSFTESVRLNPNDAQTYLKLGVAYSSQGQYKEALAVLKMAVQIKREIVDAQGFYHLGTAYANVGKNSEALDAFKQALYIVRADAVDQQGKVQNAPPLAHIYHGLGAMYYNLQRPNDAIKELKRAIELNPKFADAYYVLAISYIAVGNRKSAETQRNTLRTLNSPLAGRLDKALSSHDSGVHCRSVFGGCQ